jgi:hypothetical protein
MPELPKTKRSRSKSLRRRLGQWTQYSSLLPSKMRWGRDYLYLGDPKTGRAIAPIQKRPTSEYFAVHPLNKTWLDKQEELGASPQVVFCQMVRLYDLEQPEDYIELLARSKLVMSWADCHPELVYQRNWYRIKSPLDRPGVWKAAQGQMLKDLVEEFKDKDLDWVGFALKT